MVWFVFSVMAVFLVLGFVAVLKQLEPQVRYLRFEPRDIWIGVFWDHLREGYAVYVCPIPMWVIRIDLVPKEVER